MHTQYMYFELGMYFLMNTLLISLFSGAHSRQKYGLQPYFCLIGQNMSKP